jgi:hypothetical protein
MERNTPEKIRLAVSFPKREAQAFPLVPSAKHDYVQLRRHDQVFPQVEAVENHSSIIVPFEPAGRQRKTLP